MMRVFVRLPILLLLLATIVAIPDVRTKAMPNPRIQEAIELMTAFAERTGLHSEHPEQRYLWTDAFAVCNFLALAHVTGEPRYAEMALRLVDRVHHTLGRHRANDSRKDWISGLSEEEGEAHPTRGGLRIGKELPERRPDQAFDERLEWDRDGQYFHYLTKWMHALDQVARFMGQARFNVWARELADRAYRAFVYPHGGSAPRRMVWKMSIDLSRQLVASMGQHDSLDGYVTDLQLRATAERFPTVNEGPVLEKETREYRAMIASGRLETADPLGLGGLLIDAYRLEQLIQQGSSADPRLLETLLAAALAGLEHYAASGELQRPPAYRLAFRELGLAIGLHAVRLMRQAADSDTTRTSMTDSARSRLSDLMRYAPLGETIVSFWRAPEHKRSPRWVEHRDINEVMLATSLVPEGFLVLRAGTNHD